MELHHQTKRKDTLIPLFIYGDLGSDLRLLKHIL
jgi:hypothetical protein